MTSSPGMASNHAGAAFYPTGKHIIATKGGIALENPFDGLLSFREATDLWGLNESTLRKAVTYGKLQEGIDVKKFGKQWIITRCAMEREYGPQPQPPGDTSSC